MYKACASQRPIIAHENQFATSCTFCDFNYCPVPMLFPLLLLGSTDCLDILAEYLAKYVSLEVLVSLPVSIVVL